MKAVYLVLCILVASVESMALEPVEIVRGAVDYWRGQSSKTEAEMIIHRPSWERRLSITSYTRGSEMSLVRFTAPPKDAGNATLSLDDETWTFSPKVNRVVKIPPSMKAQSWMGSDFSYRDLTKADDIVDQYDHKLLRTESSAGHKVYVIESIPKEFAPVVWGREVLFIRDDHIFIRHEFYDQQGKLVKVMEAKEVGPLGGRVYPKVMRVSKVEAKDEWTEVRHNMIEFDADIPESLFTLSSLSSQR